MNNQRNDDPNGNDADCTIFLPFMFFILDGSILISSFAAGIIGLCAINIASLSVSLQHLLLNQRKNLSIAYDVTNIDFNSLFHCIHDISSQLYECRQSNYDSTPLYNRELITAIRLATERVIFEDMDEESEDNNNNNNSAVNIVTDDDDEDDEEELDNFNEDSNSSEINSDTTSEEQNACLISTSSDSGVDENSSITNYDEDEEEEEDNNSTKIEKTETEDRSTVMPVQKSTSVETTANVVILSEEENKEEEIVDKHYLHESAVVF